MVFSLKFSQKKIYCVLLHMSLNAYFLQWFKLSDRETSQFYARVTLLGLAKSTTYVYRKPFTNISSMEPAIFVNRLSGLFWSFPITFEDNWSFNANLEKRGFR